jgi:hypothetical protein
VFLPEPRPPLELVDLAIERLVDEDDAWGPGAWLADVPAVELAELRSAANDRVAKFEECFPPLDKAWRPRLESAARVQVPGNPITLRAKVDLALGRARGTEARVLVVDFKSGRPYGHHLDDLRFYALLETLRSGVPPFRVATYYLDSGTWHHEDVTVGLLQVALRRVIAAVVKQAELRLAERRPVATAGPGCASCDLRRDCDAGSAFLADTVEEVA